MKTQKGALSGGTVASLINSMYDQPAKDRQAILDPYCLDPPDSKCGPGADCLERTRRK